MQAKVSYGGVEYTFDVEGKDEKDAMSKVIALANIPKYCDVCGNKEYFKLDSNRDKDGNIYIKAVCTSNGCFAQAGLGTYKAGGFFWKKFEKYVKKDN